MTTIDRCPIDHLRLARRRLYHHLSDRVESDGAIRDRCGSRILESALLLDLLRKERTRGDAQEALTSFLRRARPDGVLDTAVAAAATGRPMTDGEVRSHLDGFRHFTGARKLTLLETLLATLGALPFSDCADPGDVPHEEQAVWTEVTLRAVRILHAAHRGRDFPDLDADRRRLIASLRSFAADAVWQGNALAHLIALHALHTYQPGSTLLRDGLLALVRTANPDGGMPFIAGQEVFVTALAGTALAGTGDPDAVVPRMATYVADRQLADGGWGYDETTTQSDVDDASRCTVLLRLATPDTHRRQLRRADDYLLGMADATGGWPTYVRGHVPEPDVTAVAVLALVAEPRRHMAALEQGANHLLDSQREDGTWQQSWTLSESSVIGHAVEALDRTQAHVPQVPRSRISSATAKAVQRLVLTQNSDGGWGQRQGAASDALSTAQALPTVVRHGPEDAADRAIAHLLEQQEPDGAFTSPADQVGPRPLPFDFPVLAGIQALTALNAAAETRRDGRLRQTAVGR